MGKLTKEDRKESLKYWSQDEKETFRSLMIDNPVLWKYDDRCKWKDKADAYQTIAEKMGKSEDKVKTRLKSMKDWYKSLLEKLYKDFVEKKRTLSGNDLKLLLLYDFLRKENLTYKLRTPPELTDEVYYDLIYERRWFNTDEQKKLAEQRAKNNDGTSDDYDSSSTPDSVNLQDSSQNESSQEGSRHSGSNRRSVVRDDTSSRKKKQKIARSETFSSDSERDKDESRQKGFKVSDKIAIKKVVGRGRRSSSFSSNSGDTKHVSRKELSNDSASDTRDALRVKKGSQNRKFNYISSDSLSSKGEKRNASGSNVYSSDRTIDLSYGEGSDSNQMVADKGSNETNNEYSKSKQTEERKSSSMPVAPDIDTTSELNVTASQTKRVRTQSGAGLADIPFRKRFKFVGDRNIFTSGLANVKTFESNTTFSAISQSEREQLRLLNRKRKTSTFTESGSLEEYIRQQNVDLQIALKTSAENSEKDTSARSFRSDLRIDETNSVRLSHSPSTPSSSVDNLAQGSPSSVGSHGLHESTSHHISQTSYHLNRPPEQDIEVIPSKRAKLVDYSVSSSSKGEDTHDTYGYKASVSNVRFVDDTSLETNFFSDVKGFREDLQAGRVGILIKSPKAKVLSVLSPEQILSDPETITLSGDTPLISSPSSSLFSLSPHVSPRKFPVRSQKFEHIRRWSDVKKKRKLRKPKSNLSYQDDHDMQHEYAGDSEWLTDESNSVTDVTGSLFVPNKKKFTYNDWNDNLVQVDVVLDDNILSEEVEEDMYQPTQPFKAKKIQDLHYRTSLKYDVESFQHSGLRYAQEFICEDIVYPCETLRPFKNYCTNVRTALCSTLPELPKARRQVYPDLLSVHCKLLESGEISCSVLGKHLGLGSTAGIPLIYSTPVSTLKACWSVRLLKDGCAVVPIQRSTLKESKYLPSSQKRFPLCQVQKEWQPTNNPTMHTQNRNKLQEGKRAWFDKNKIKMQIRTIPNNLNEDQPVLGVATLYPTISSPRSITPPDRLLGKTRLKFSSDSALRWLDSIMNRSHSIMDSFPDDPMKAFQSSASTLSSLWSMN